MTDLCGPCHKARRQLYRAPYLLTWLGESNDIRKRPATCSVCPKLAAWQAAWKVVKPKRLSPEKARKAMEDLLCKGDVRPGVRLTRLTPGGGLIPVNCVGYVAPPSPPSPVYSDPWEGETDEDWERACAKRRAEIDAELAASEERRARDMAEAERLGKTLKEYWEYKRDIEHMDWADKRRAEMDTRIARREQSVQPQDVKLRMEREKTKQVEADFAARIAEGNSAARIAEAEVRKLELQLELFRLQRS
jgi:hypothetical protein